MRTLRAIRFAKLPECHISTTICQIKKNRLISGFRTTHSGQRHLLIPQKDRVPVHQV
jgi:hypothetical protein